MHNTILHNTILHNSMSDTFRLISDQPDEQKSNVDRFVQKRLPSSVLTYPPKRVIHHSVPRAVHPSTPKMEVFSDFLDLIKPHFGGLVAGSVLSIAFNTAARANPDARRLVAGTPLYIYAVAMIFQALVFAPTAYVAWSRWGFDYEWFKEGWTTARGSVNVNPMGDKKRIERIYLYSLFGYMIKDMWIFRNDFLFFTHHLICLFGILAFFAIPAGIGSFVVGGTVLELGNFSYNIVLLAGKDSSKVVPKEVKHATEMLYAICMPISNFIGASMFVSFSQFPKLRGTPWVMGLGSAWFLLIAGREYVHLSRSVPYFVRHFKGKMALARSNVAAAGTAAKMKKAKKVA